MLPRYNKGWYLHTQTGRYHYLAFDLSLEIVQIPTVKTKAFSTPFHQYVCGISCEGNRFYRHNYICKSKENIGECASLFLCFYKLRTLK